MADYGTEVKLALAEPDPLILEELKKTFRRKEITFYLANPFELEGCYRLYLDPFSSSFYRWLYIAEKATFLIKGNYKTGG